MVVPEPCVLNRSPLGRTASRPTETMRGGNPFSGLPAEAYTACLKASATSPTPPVHVVNTLVVIRGTSISTIDRLPTRRSYIATRDASVIEGAGSSSQCDTAGTIRNSFSGKDFLVRIGRGKLLLPLGHPGSLQKLRMCDTNAVICAGVSESSNAGICGER